ncbi:MAG: hypothetical protein WB615_15745 [Candidatus Tumulicola sp.]
MPTNFMLKSHRSVAVHVLSSMSAIALTLAGIGATGAQSNGATVTEGSALLSGFYRNADKPTVYRVLNGNICAVLSEDHLRALGATHKSIHVVGDSVDFLNGKPFDPSCPWPDGLYRKRGEDYVIKVSDGTACILSSTDENVHQVTSDNLLLQGRNFVGRCKR